MLLYYMIKDYQIKLSYRGVEVEVMVAPFWNHLDKVTTNFDALFTILAEATRLYLEIITLTLSKAFIR